MMNETISHDFLSSVAEAVGRTISVQGEIIYLTEKIAQPGEKYHMADLFLDTKEGWEEVRLSLMELRNKMCFIGEKDMPDWQKWIQAERYRAYWVMPSTKWDTIFHRSMPIWKIEVLDQSRSCWISVPSLSIFLWRYTWGKRTLQDINHYRFFILTRGKKQAVLLEEKWSGYNEGPHRNPERKPFFPVAIFLPQ